MTSTSEIGAVTTSVGTVVVTGASGNLGRACVDLFEQQGYRVAAVDLSTADDSNDSENLAWFAADVTNESDVERVHAAIVDRFGAVSVLVNAAGIARGTRFADISVDEWDLVLGVSLTGSFLMTQTFLPQLRDATFGRVINFSSTAGKNVSTLAGAHYTAAKAGLLGLTRALAKELGPLGITVNAICPGVFETNMARSLSNGIDLDAYARTLPVPRLGIPSEVAELVAFLASENAAYITGAALDINGGELMV